MTTIAWDGTTLAVDRQATLGNSISTAYKLHECGDFVLAVGGTVDHIYTALEWVEAGCKPEERPQLLENVRGIAVQQSRHRVYILEGIRPYLVRARDKYIAVGSGQDYAIAAMHLGLDAAAAIKFTARFDAFTGKGVDTWSKRS
jgi:ATP-dependent protease HslVU (ClpYQ) peptidase subunit